MKLAGRYAYASRDWVCDRVVSVLGARVLDSVHNHYDFAWRETHNGRDLWVVRKGATPAFPGQRGFVGGTMAKLPSSWGGIETEHASLSLYSTIHGAGLGNGPDGSQGQAQQGWRVDARTEGHSGNDGRLGE
jgi:tRNA-splicing ligase RtcB